MRTTLDLATPVPDFHTSLERGCWTLDVRFSRQHTRRIFGEIGFRTWNPLSRNRNRSTGPHQPLFTFSYTKYTKRKYCNRQKIRTRDFDESPRFRPA
ncbi:hypothetical protein AVEN_196064-1 [Araneus ventricosus]|uniref:Uncharacterized protein n=1 Tax=Araneus ventricosus TaxID=182803 RepID=A0A4Y2NR79_ARAVE|nr:hypothetical protein AVEN_196064-1 [Araneus ventricosus]